MQFQPDINAFDIKESFNNSKVFYTIDSLIEYINEQRNFNIGYIEFTYLYNDVYLVKGDNSGNIICLGLSKDKLS